MGGRNGVQTDNARIRFCNSIFLRLAFFIRLCLLCQGSRIDQLVAPEASLARTDRPDGADDIEEHPGRILSDL
jgi:hypothetical protein